MTSYDHLSIVDPQDEFLKLENGSVIESISEARKSNASGIMSSGYSAIEFNDMMQKNT